MSFYLELGAESKGGEEAKAIEGVRASAKEDTKPSAGEEKRSGEGKSGEDQLKAAAKGTSLEKYAAVQAHEGASEGEQPAVQDIGLSDNFRSI